MNRFLQALLFGPPCAEVLSGRATYPRPCTDTEREINGWRVDQFRERQKRWVRAQPDPDQAEEAVTRAFEGGLLIQAAWRARFRRKRPTVRPVLQLAVQRRAN